MCACAVLGALLCSDLSLTLVTRSGGRSHCGYSDVVHESLMAVGQHLHSLFGEPSDFVHETMLDVGNYFQEISYAARDIYRGHTMIEKTSDIVDE